MTQIEIINEKILSVIKKDDEFYQALWGKVDFTPEDEITLPNDFNCGAIANGIEYVYQFVREITGQELEDLDDPYLDIVVYFFTGIIRLGQESDAKLISRMRALLERKDIWKSESLYTPWDILNVFSYYISRDQMFYVPNLVLTDILINGDFETAIGAEWTFSSGDRSLEDAFTGQYKVDMPQSISQTIAVTAGTYIIHAFVNPSVGDVMDVIVQRDSDNYYYDMTLEGWVAAKPDNIYTAEVVDWQLFENFVVADGSYNIDITFDKINDFLIDRIEFGEKLYPAFELVIIDSGVPAGFMSLWGSDPTVENASYFDQDFMFASSISSFSDTYYQDLLRMVTMSGVEGIFTRETRS